MKVREITLKLVVLEDGLDAADYANQISDIDEDIVSVNVVDEKVRDATDDEEDSLGSRMKTRTSRPRLIRPRKKSISRDGQVGASYTPAFPCLLENPKSEEDTNLLAAPSSSLPNSTRKNRGETTPCLVAIGDFP